jgi:hypothetical protein
MEEYQSIFKTCLQAAAITFRVKFSEFDRARNISLFMVDECIKPSTPKELAAKALSGLCVGDLSPMDNAVCVGVVQFLDRMREILPGDCDSDRRILDAIQLVNQLQSFSESQRYDQCMRWANTWYG